MVGLSSLVQLCEGTNWRLKITIWWADSHDHELHQVVGPLVDDITATAA